MTMIDLQMERAIFMVRDAYLEATAVGAHFDEIAVPDWVLDMEADIEAESFDPEYEPCDEPRDYGVRASETDEYYERNDAGEYINRM